MERMSEILFIRHAETDMAGTFCGHSDPELNARGRDQVCKLIDRLRGEDFEAVYTSDLRRAHATGSSLAAAFALDCHVRPALREIDFGSWEGLTWEEIEKRDQDFARRWSAEYPNLPAPGGERFSDFEQRVIGEVEFMSTEADVADRPILVVTHAGVLRSVLQRLQGRSDAEAWERTREFCSIVRYSGLAHSYWQRDEVRA
jgi:broad specificity phosphatase PhoE